MVGDGARKPPTASRTCQNKNFGGWLAAACQKDPPLWRCKPGMKTPVESAGLWAIWVVSPSSLAGGGRTAVESCYQALKQRMGISQMPEIKRLNSLWTRSWLLASAFAQNDLTGFAMERVQGASMQGMDSP